MLDGVNTDGTAGYFDMGAVEEMIVRPAGNDPEIPTPGMAFQAIVKSGGNTFKGDGLYAWQGRSLQSNNVDDELRAQGVTGGNPMDHYYDANFSFGGRIIRDKALVLHAARAARNTARKCWASPAPRAPTASTSRPTTRQGLQSDSENNLTGKSDGAAHARSIACPTCITTTTRRPTTARGNAFRPHEATGFYDAAQPHRARRVALHDDRSLGVQRLGRAQLLELARRSHTPTTRRHSTTSRSAGLGAYVNSIGADSTPAGSLSGRWQFDASYSYFLPKWLGGTHEFKAGGYFTQDVYNKFQEARAEGTGGVGNDYLLYFSNSAPFEVLLYNSPFVSKNTVNYQSGYARDNWRIGERLTVSYGLRVERYNAFLPEQSKPARPVLGRSGLRQGGPV